MEKIKFINILGVKYLCGGYQQAEYLVDQGGLMVVPAAPNLADIYKDKYYYDSIKNCDFAIPDSGLMVVLTKIFKRNDIKKISGLEFLKNFLKKESLTVERSLFLIDPSLEERRLNQRYLSNQNIKIEFSDHYVAPFYKIGNMADQKLLAILEKKKPKYILINIGGGVQEKLGFFLKESLSYRPGIICTGAAIAFLTGKQAQIPPAFEKFYIAWLARCIDNPRVFIPRYFKALKFIPIFIKEAIL